MEVVIIAYEIECRFAVYMDKVFQSDIDMQSDATVGQFLHSRMANTKYCILLSSRGTEKYQAVSC